MNKSIEIIGVDAQGNLMLSPGSARVFMNKNSPDRMVTWRISNPGHNPVKSFKLLGKNKSENPPFNQPLPTTFNTVVHLDVDHYSPNIDWAYSIFWNDETGPGKTLDPIISIRPSNNESLFQPIIKIILALLSIVSLTLFFQKFRKK